MNIQGGNLTGNGTITGNVTNHGILAPGASAGKLTIQGNYTQGSLGQLAIKLGGTTAGTGYDQLEVSGSVTLAGSLQVTSIGDFTPAPQASFLILLKTSANDIIGTFDGFAEGSILPDGKAITYKGNDGNDVVLTAPAAPANNFPTISDITDKNTNEDTATAVIPFVVDDAETAVASLIVTVTSSNTAPIPNSPDNLALGGSGANRTLTITPSPNASGTTTITVSVQDAAGQTTRDSFVLTVVAVNDPPTLNAIPNPTAISEDAGQQTVILAGIMAGGGEIQTLIVTAASDNPVLIPNPTVSYSSPSTTGSLVYTPVANQSGTATITVTVRDAGLDNTLETPDDGTFARTFTVTVNLINDRPTISDVTDKQTTTGAPVGPIPFTIGDVETAAASLTVSGSSSDTTLVPNANIVFGGSGASRTVTITPAPGQTGTSTITITVSDGGLSASDTFVLTVNPPANTAPTISDISDQSTPEDTPTGTINFTVGDVQTDVDALIVTATSSNTALVPNASANLTLGGSGANRTLTITPAANVSGTATITVTLQDAGGFTATDFFVLTVVAVNDLPTLNTIGNRAAINEDAGQQTVNLSGITAGGGESQALTVTASSSNTSLIPHPTVTYTSPNSTGSLSYTPMVNQGGTATVTVTVRDAGLDGTPGNADDGTFARTFTVMVNPVNDRPTISDITDKQTTTGMPVGPIPFSVGDVETSTGSLAVSGTSSNTSLVPNANIVFGVSGANRTITITPASGQTGTATITVTVSDGSLRATDTFVLTVAPPANTPPTISDIPDLTTSEDTATGAFYSVSDAETLSQLLTVTATSSNTALIPNANVTFDTIFGNRIVGIVPTPHQFGTATITVVVKDAGNLTATDTFVLTVTPVNDRPTISDITDKQTTSGTAVGPIPFTIGDVETPAASLTVSGTSSDTTLVPNANIVFGGSGANQTVTVTPVAGQSGTATVTISVSDGNLSATDTFVLTVAAPVVSLDFSDAPASYGTAWHNSTGGILGLQWDAEPDANISADARGDDITGIDDEDGVSVSNLVVGSSTTWAIRMGGAGGRLDAWVDFNRDGTFAPTLERITAPGGTTLSAGGGSLTFAVPTTAQAGTTFARFRLNDQGGLLPTGAGQTLAAARGEVEDYQVTVALPANRPPIAHNDPNYNTTQDNVINVGSAGGVLANDTDPDGNPLTAILVTRPTNGSLTLNPNGSFGYTPNLGFTGFDSFTYKANDSRADSNVATVTIQVTAHAAVAGYQQPPTLVNIFESHRSPSSADQTYDNFRFTADTHVSAVQWRGAYVGYVGELPDARANPASPNTSTWNISFWSDAAGLPGSQLRGADFAAASVQRTFVGNQPAYETREGGLFVLTFIPGGSARSIGNVSLFDFRVTLPTPFLAQANTTYWFSPLSLAGSFNPGFYWQSGSGGNATSINGRSSVSQDRTFTLFTSPIARDDGVPDAIENAAPNNGDGNFDGIRDSLQANVASLPNAANGLPATLESSGGTRLGNVAAIPNPAPATAPAGVNFGYGFFRFDVNNVAPGGATTVTLYMPHSTVATSYWKYGRTPVNQTPHWYNFVFDGSTGAQFFNSTTGPSKIVLRFVDGQRGDNDLLANGTIVDPGGPGVTAAPPVLTSLTTNAAKPGNVVEGQIVSLTATFADPHIAGVPKATIHWGDGTFSAGVVAEVKGVSTISGSHTYANGGLYTISVTVTDGGQSDSEVTEAIISGAGVHDRILYVIGTDTNDHVSVNQQGKGLLKVHADFLPTRSFKVFSSAEIDRIYAFLFDGDDHMTVAGNIDLPMILDGGGGQDHLKGGPGPKILLGGADSDRLLTGGLAELLIGWLDGKGLQDQGGKDRLIKGPIEPDAKTRTILFLLNEWNPSRGSSASVANAKGTSRRPKLNENFLLDESFTILDDEKRFLLKGNSSKGKP